MLASRGNEIHINKKALQRDKDWGIRKKNWRIDESRKVK